MILHINHMLLGQARRAGELVTAVLGLVEQGQLDARLSPGLNPHLDWIRRAVHTTRGGVP